MRFVLLDELLALEPGRRVEARVTFSPDLEIFADHFPGRPIVPGSLLTEAMGQAAGWLLVRTLDFTRWPVLTAIDQAKFYRFVAPGEEIRLAATITGSRPDSFEARAEAGVGGRRVARARLLFGTDALTLDGAGTEALETWGRRVFAELGGDRLEGAAGAAP